MGTIEYELINEPGRKEVRRIVSAAGKAIFGMRVACFPGEEDNWVYLVLGESTTLIDPGLNQAQTLRDLLAGLEAIDSHVSRRVALDTIDYVLVTHNDNDHGGLTGILQGQESPLRDYEPEVFLNGQRLRARVVCHELQRDAFSRKRRYWMTGLEPWKLLELMTMGPSQVKGRIVPFLLKLDDDAISASEKERLWEKVQDGLERHLSFGNRSPMPDIHDVVVGGDVVTPDGIEVIDTPGHRDGHIALLADNVLFTGDFLFARFTPEIDHVDTVERSALERMLQAYVDLNARGLGDDYVVLPGHDEWFRDPTETTHEAIERILRKLVRIWMGCLSRGKILQELTVRKNREPVTGHEMFHLMNAVLPYVTFLLKHGFMMRDRKGTTSYLRSVPGEQALRDFLCSRYGDCVDSLSAKLDKVFSEK